MPPGVLRRCLSLLTVLLLTSVGLVVVPSTAEPAAAAAPTVVKAAAVTGFDPGNIIDDAVFFNATTMSADQIQAFLNSKVPSCQAGYTCLPNYGQATATRPADAVCGSTYTGRSWESAASIIYNVAQACGINPQVLIVMLQKEQGLVTHTWPSDWRYTIAMGQGCPDTAACDTRYYGFFNQVYGAAWQLRRYANPPGTSQFFTWYAPGRTWNILYNPNTACGSSPVTVRNQATADLYYYTPYQPNAAALAAGYGTGDGCSAYGNRNFYNYFTEWFGSVRGSVTALVRSASSPNVYLTAGNRRWHVTDGEDFGELTNAFGPVSVVSDDYISQLIASGTTTAILRDESTGVMSLVQGGQLHRLGSCEAVVQWGGSCINPTNVPSALLNRLAAGAEVGEWYRVRTTGRWGHFEAIGAANPFYNEAAARAAAGDPRTALYAPYISPTRLAALSLGVLRFAPAQLVKSNADPKVYLTTDFDGLRWVTSWDTVADLNRTPADLAVVSPQELAGYHDTGALAAALQCGSVTYLPSAGWLYPVPDAATTAVPAMSVGAATCAQFSVAPAPAGRDVAIKVPGSPSVWVLERGMRLPVLGWQQLIAHNDGIVPPVLTVNSPILTSLPEGSPIADGLLVKGSGADIALADGTARHRLPTAQIADDLGLSMQWRPFTDAQYGALAAADELGAWVRCDGRIGFGAGGVVYPVSAAAATGFTPTGLGAATCFTLNRSTTTDLDVVAVKTSSSPEVYVAQNGQWHLATSWSSLLAANKGSVPTILVVAGLSGIPLGPPLP